VQRPLMCWPSGWPVGPTLQPHMAFLCSDALQEAVECNPRPGVSGGHAQWPADHVARLAGQELANYQLNQVGNRSYDSYKYPPVDGIHTTHSTSSSPLVKVLV
jgi:hypothetical protein